MHGSLIARKRSQGPMFVKFNGVLRGFGSNADKRTITRMVDLCCGESVSEQFRSGKLSVEQVKPHVNRYATTLHTSTLPAPWSPDCSSCQVSIGVPSLGSQLGHRQAFEAHGR